MGEFEGGVGGAEGVVAEGGWEVGELKMGVMVLWKGCLLAVWSLRYVCWSIGCFLSLLFFLFDFVPRVLSETGFPFARRYLQATIAMTRPA